MHDALPNQSNLRAMVREACHALSNLDALRLEELAVACCRLQLPREAGARDALQGQARDAAGDMAVFARVLVATRENLQVMRRLKALREGRLEYSAEASHGDD